MQVKFQLKNNRGFRWVKKGSFYLKGYIFDLNEKLYLEGDLAEYFTGIRSYSDFEERVSYANGCFSVIYKKGDIVYTACDIIRAFPLFYTKEDDGWIISDDASFLHELIKNPEINQHGSIEFLATGYVTGSETLVSGINQVQAGEILRFENNDLRKKFYYTYRISKPFETDYEEFRSEGIKIFNNAFKRFIASLKGRTVLVPLSGGFDSRMIAAMLKKYDYDKVICFTYGREGNPEVEVSRKVAEILGFKWIFVKYSNELINNYVEDKVFREYFHYAGNLVSMFFMQEYFAVRYLKDNNLIPDDSIFAPGHSGDFLGGSQLYKHGNLSIDEDISEITRRIYFVKYCNLRPKGSDKKSIIRRIEKTLEEKFTGNSALSYSVHEDWDFKEKLAKFNFNSLTTYTFFGYEFRFPFWDREIVDFFKFLPLHVKVNKFLYDDILCDEIFEPLGLNFRYELQPTDSILKRQRVKEKIKYFIPENILRLFIRRSDNLFYKEITKKMVSDLARKGKKIYVYGNTYNSLIIQWYLEEVRKMCKSKRGE